MAVHRDISVHGSQWQPIRRSGIRRGRVFVRCRASGRRQCIQPDATLGGRDPFGTLAVGVNGTLFGVTRNGGRPFPDGGGGGTVFSLTPPVASGGPWTGSLLYAFNEETGDGAQPMAGVLVGRGGVLYGTTTHGGGGWGTVFALTPAELSGGPMKEIILYSCTGTNGSDDGSSLVLGPNGVLYGTTYDGGAKGCGMVFELAPPAHREEGGQRSYCIASRAGRMAS